ncbi:MAG: hypothetical protein R3A79_18170 [Nannocystaceae bacterium]
MAGTNLMRDRTLLTAATAALLCLAAAPAKAQSPDSGSSAAPGADAFDIRYYVTDGEGNRVRQMTKNDMQYFVNQARCECGQKIDSQVRILNTGTTYAQILIDGFIGTQCATAETSFNPQFKRCTKFSSTQTNNYVSGQGVAFAPIWLVSGIVEAGEGTNDELRHPDLATPASTCSGPTGEGGIWLCGQSDSVAGCQAEEFFIQGATNKNYPEGESSKGITADFQPPQSLPLASSIDASVGDSAVVVTWTLPTGGTDAYGFRVLCEEADTGLPGVEGVAADPGIAANSYGTIYYTKENLCPDGPFWEPDGWDDSTTGGTDTDGTTTDGTTTDGTTTDTDTTDGTTTDGTTTDGTTTDGTTTDGTTTDGTTTDTDTTDGTTTGGSDSGVCPEDRPASGVCSLKWDYICSEHLAKNTNSTRIKGLENGKKYNFLLVAYDQSGNPISVGKIDNIEPVQTNDLWEQCEEDGDVCGRAGFCDVDPERSAGGGLALLAGLVLLTAAGRRIRKTA